MNYIITQSNKQKGIQWKKHRIKEVNEKHSIHMKIHSLQRNIKTQHHRLVYTHTHKIFKKKEERTVMLRKALWVYLCGCLLLDMFLSLRMICL